MRFFEFTNTDEYDIEDQIQTAVKNAIDAEDRQSLKNQNASIKNNTNNKAIANRIKARSRINKIRPTRAPAPIQPKSKVNSLSLLSKQKLNTLAHKLDGETVFGSKLRALDKLLPPAEPRRVIDLF